MDMSQGYNHGDRMTMAGDGGGRMTMKTMQMSFYWGKGATVLFSGWPGERTGMYVPCLLFIFFLAAVLEILYLILDGKTAGAGRPAGQAIVHGIRMGMAYLVMLAVMSFNGGVFIAAVLGHAFGLFVVKARAAAEAKHAADNNSISACDKP